MSRCLYLLGPLALISLSIPLAFLAVVTTALAFSTLLLRVSIVYFDLGLAVVHSWLFIDPTPTPASIRSVQPASSSDPFSNQQRRHRRRLSGGVLVKIAPSTHRPPKKSESFASLIGSSNPNRDFEGVGGWSLTNNGQEDAVWLMNSRLQLSTPSGEHRRRHHQRSLTSGSLRLVKSPESMHTSPVESRARTPAATERTMSAEGYFNVESDEGSVPLLEEPTGRKRSNEKQRIITSSTVSSPGLTRSSRL